MKAHMNVPIFIPHLGCPHNCAFCSQKSVTNVQAAPSPESVAFSIKKQLATRGDRIAEIAFFGGSFTGIPKAKQAAYLESVQPFLKSGEAESLRISTRPDYVDKETVAFLKAYGVKTVELGAQSMCDRVLRAANRGHTAADTVAACAHILSGGLRLGLQMMTGLPASTPADEMETARQFVALGASDARIYPTVVFFDTDLYSQFLSGEYTPPSMEETVERAAACLAVLEEGGVQVIRIGLQETETLGGCAAAGAYHPAMGEMVRARLWRNRLETAANTLGGRELTVFCPERLTSLVLGHKRENFLYITEKYGIKLQLRRGEVPALSDGEKWVAL
ncbi:MAG: radical SAM protein [Ruminococcaceae bacterium]|nr:radical SAM protein [Oscillospiraceae bacterium]